MWDQDDLHAGDERLERFVRGLAGWPLRWRAAVIVGTADARPQEVFRVADPSIWPLVAGGGLLLIFLGELTKLRWGIAIGALALLGAAIAWNWPVEAPMTEEEEDAFEQEHGVPVNAGGSVVVAAWGMGLGVLFLGIAFASLLLAYFYLRLENPAWPPPGLAEPGVTRALAAAALVVASGSAARFGLRRLASGDRPGLVLGLVGALGAGGTAIAVQVADLVHLDIGWTTHAYGSIFSTLSGFVVLVTGGALIMTAMVLYWSLRGLYTARRHAALSNVATFWTATQVIWVVGFATLYLGPALT